MTTLLSRCAPGAYWDAYTCDGPGAGLTEPKGSRDTTVSGVRGTVGQRPWGTDRYTVQTVLLDQMGSGRAVPGSAGTDGGGRSARPFTRRLKPNRYPPVPHIDVITPETLEPRLAKTGPDRVSN